MQQAIRLKRNQYERETYQEWKQLPPSLPRPNTESVAVFLLSFDKLVYLNQGSSNGEQIQLKLEWWGMNTPHRLAYEASNQCKGKYIVCSSIERLLAYLFDMKLLSIEISTKVKTMGKAYLNFAVLKGWKGEMYEGSLDIKQGSKKIGELDYSISIQDMQNPYANQVETEVIKASKANNQINVRVNPPSVQEIVRKASIRSKQENFPIIDEVIMPKHRTSTSNSHRMYEQDKLQSIKPAKNDKFTSTSILQFPVQVHHRHFDNNYETEMIRLIEDYNLLFDKGSNNIFPQDNKENSVQIEIVKIQTNNKDNVQIQVTVPLIDGNQNYYKLSAGGLIKLQLGNKTSQQQLLNYLKQCNISFKCGQKIEGSIKLSKLLARTDEVLEVQLLQRQGKRQTKKAKGVCFIRAIPPQKDTIIEPPTKEDRQADVKTQIKQEEYILINLKHYNPIEKNNRLYNLFIKTINEDQNLGESKTLWNSKLCCFFDEKLTYKIYSNKIIFQLYDRQQTLIRLAIGELALDSPLGVNLEVPLLSKHMNMNVVVGYLSIDYFKNGLEGVTKMIPILKREKEATKQEDFQQREKEAIPKPEPQQIKENIIDQWPQKAEIQDPNKQEDKENNVDINTQEKKELPEQINRKQVKKLSIIEIHNRLFTFLHTNSQLLQLLQEKNQHKVTEFLNHFSPIIQKNILTISQLNQLICQYLYSSPQHINKISTTAFIESYESFSTYYQQLVQQKDQLLHTFLLILEGTGISINDLEHQLRDRKIWNKINLIFSNKKNSNINIVEDLKRYYQKKDETFVKYGIFDQLTGPQFCDILRKYEVYETSLGSQINEELLSQRVYRNTIELLKQLQADIELYSYRQLIAFMEQEQIILSEWQHLNLREYLSKYNDRKTVPKYPNFSQQPQKKQPTISKSPTFGYLHQPQHKPEPLTSDNYMVDSLAVKMQNLAISPINYNSNQTIQGNLHAIFSNLAHKIQEMYVNGARISLESVDSISPHNYKSNSISQPQHSHTDPLSKQREKDLSNPSQKPSTPNHQLQSYKSESQEQKSHFQLQIATDIAFSYHVQLQLAQLQQAVQLQCLHGQWCALATEDGDYLGSICIS